MRLFFIILLLLVVGGTGATVGFGYYLIQEAEKDPPQYTIQINEHTLYVETAITSEEWNRGLSYRETLPQNHGLLFVSPQLTLPSFWMYGMQFPLDIIWVKDGIIVDIDEQVPNPDKDTPMAELPTYRAPSAVDMVLEVNAGWVETYGIQPGDKIVGLETIPKQKSTHQIWGTLLKNFLDNL